MEAGELGTEGSGERRPLLISRAWVQSAALVFLFGFFVLGLLAYRTYQAEPPSRLAWSTRTAASLTLIVLAALMAAAGLVRHHDPVELAALGGVLALSALAGRRLAPAFGREAETRLESVIPPSSPAEGTGESRSYA